MVTGWVMFVDKSFFELFGCLFTHAYLMMGVSTKIGASIKVKGG
jgi:hypothetical protein